MTFGSTIIVLFIFILAGLLVMRPFLVKNDQGDMAGMGSYDSLLAEKERLYASIEELDQNLELEKISPDEHARGRDELLYQAARILKDLDGHPFSAKKETAPARVSIEDDQLEKMIAERRKRLGSSQAAACPNCGKPVVEGDQFCSHCGGKL